MVMSREIIYFCNLVLFSCLAHAVALTSAIAVGGPGHEPALGVVIPELRFRDIRGLDRNIAELGKHQAYVFVFTTTTCPIVRRSMPKLIDLYRRFEPQGVQFVAVNVGADDTLREMAEQAIDFAVPFPFVKDLELNCAQALGVKRTPQVAVLDEQRRLVYRGRIDDQFRLGGARVEPSRKDLEMALEQLLANQPIDISETPVDGCEITPPLPYDREVVGDLEYHRDIAPLLDRKCNHCHRAGTAAPFSLQSYEDVAGNAAMISRVVEDEQMPPWFASKRHGRFQNDASLDDEEKSLLQRWIHSGRKRGVVPPGDSVSAEGVESSSDEDRGWQIGEPDLVITMLEQHDVPATGFVPYKYTVLPHLFLQDTWVEAFEIRPDNRAVVHHCNMAYVTIKGGSQETFITGFAPGTPPMDLKRFDNGAAFLVPKGSTLGLQIHYTTTGQPERCRISVGLRFPRRTVQKRLGHFLLDPRGFKIAPYDPAYEVRSKHTLERDVNLLGMFTHMHVRGKDMTFFADVPGQSRETLLRIPNYNFEWQLAYELFPGDKLLPRGTVVEAIAHYDNSTFNPYNPDPSRSVGYGLQTVDEMFNGFVFFVDQHEQLGLVVDPKTGREIRSGE
jgi:peroxiredoxin